MTDNDTTQSVGESEREGQSAVRYDDETVLWEGRPSQWINLGTFIWWGIFFIGSTILLLLWEDGLNANYNTAIKSLVQWSCYGLIALSCLCILYAFLSVYYEYTIITRNKISERKGITRIFREELHCELSDIKDLKSPPAGILGVLNLSTLVIETNDLDQPIINIRAIRDRDKLVNLLLPMWRKLKMDRKGYFGD